MNHSHTVSAQQFCCQMRVFRISFGVVLVVLLVVICRLGNNNDWNDQLSVPNLASFDRFYQSILVSVADTSSSRPADSCRLNKLFQWLILLLALENQKKWFQGSTMVFQASTCNCFTCATARAKCNSNSPCKIFMTASLALELKEVNHRLKNCTDPWKLWIQV